MKMVFSPTGRTVVDIVEFLRGKDINSLHALEGTIFRHGETYVMFCQVKPNTFILMGMDGNRTSEAIPFSEDTGIFRELFRRFVAARHTSLRDVFELKKVVKHNYVFEDIVIKTEKKVKDSLVNEMMANPAIIENVAVSIANITQSPTMSEDDIKAVVIQLCNMFDDFQSTSVVPVTDDMIVTAIERAKTA